MDDHPAPPPWFGWSLLAATAGGLLLRAIHLDAPMRYDELVTLTSYALQGPERVLGSYETPNNHVFHTLLVYWSTSAWGRSEFVTRLPAFLAGVLLVPAVAWWGLKMYGARVGAAAAILVAASPILVEFSANARGYTLLCLLMVCAAALAKEYLEEPSGLRLGALGLLGLLTIYTIPVGLIPWAGLMVWFGVALLTRTPAAGRIAAAGRLTAFNVAVLALAIALYWPIIRFGSWDALLANRFVESLSWSEFGRTLPDFAVALPRHWLRAVPLPVGLLLVLCFVVGATRRGRGWYGGPGPALALVALIFLLVRRSPGEPRIWMWALPFVLTAAAQGVSILTDRWMPDSRRNAAALVGAAVAGLVVAVGLVVDDPLARSLETGGYPESRELAAYIAERARPGDALMTDYVSREPLQYYLDRHRFRARVTAGGVDEMRRLWVVVNRADSRRFSDVTTRAVTNGVPLGTANPVTTIGETDLYLFAVR